MLVSDAAKDLMPEDPPARLAVSERRGPLPQSLLCVASFPANTGYAWTFIERLYASIADALAERGVRTWVAYPSIPTPPRSLARSAAIPVELDFRLSGRAFRTLIRFIRARNVRALYVPDHAGWHPAFCALRLAGVRKIIVHDHTSGQRAVPRGFKRLAKGAARRLPGALADQIIAVSDYVARRKIETELLPPARVMRSWNTVPIPEPDPTARGRLRREFGLPDEQAVVFCGCRAVEEKGVLHLLRAFDALVRDLPAHAQQVSLVYAGDGPAMDQLRALWRELPSRDRIILAGYRDDAADLAGGADVCVVPSLWQEAFGLAALEPMARGVPVIASRVGGLPEVVRDGETGLLVTPGDEAELAGAMRRLLLDPAERKRLGANGRRRAVAHFSPDAQLRELLPVFEDAFGVVAD